MEPRPSTLRLVAVPAVVTLAVTILRLTGERRGWNPTFFSTEPGGAGALVGISWLVPVFGAWFGHRLASAGAGPKRPGLAALSYLGLFAAAPGLFFVIRGLGIEFPAFGVIFSVGFFLIALVGLKVWRSLCVANLVYGLCARIPVVIITYVAVYATWGTHYEKLGPDDLQLPPFEKAFHLSMAQIGFWVAFTIMAGGFFGSLAALVGAIARNRRGASTGAARPRLETGR